MGPTRISRRQFSKALACGAAGWATLTWGCRAPAPRAGRMRAWRDPASGQVEVSEADRPVFRYNYQVIEPGPILSQVAAANRKYAVARSDYIHPLYGLNGEVLTRDWPIEHPHHRGIYWAWPEVDWRGERGDLHALQKREIRGNTPRHESRRTFLRSVLVRQHPRPRVSASPPPRLSFIRVYPCSSVVNRPCPKTGHFLNFTL